MGEAKRRGTRAERRAAPKGRPKIWEAIGRFWRYLTDAEKVKARPIPKRQRAKSKRAFKRRHGLTRSQCGAIGAGHRERPS